MIETEVRILNTGTFEGFIEIIIDNRKFILNEDEFIDFFAKVNTIATKRAMRMVFKPKKKEPFSSEHHQYISDYWRWHRKWELEHGIIVENSNQIKNIRKLTKEEWEAFKNVDQ